MAAETPEAQPTIESTLGALHAHFQAGDKLNIPGFLKTVYQVKELGHDQNPTVVNLLKTLGVARREAIGNSVVGVLEQAHQTGDVAEMKKNIAALGMLGLDTLPGVSNLIVVLTNAHRLEEPLTEPAARVSPEVRTNQVGDVDQRLLNLRTAVKLNDNGAIAIAQANRFLQDHPDRAGELLEVLTELVRKDPRNIDIYGVVEATLTKKYGNNLSIDQVRQFGRLATTPRGNERGGVLGKIGSRLPWNRSSSAEQPADPRVAEITPQVRRRARDEIRHYANNYISLIGDLDRLEAQKQGMTPEQYANWVNLNTTRKLGGIIHRLLVDTLAMNYPGLEYGLRYSAGLVEGGRYRDPVKFEEGAAEVTMVYAQASERLQGDLNSYLEVLRNFQAGKKVDPEEFAAIEERFRLHRLEEAGISVYPQTRRERRQIEDQLNLEVDKLAEQALISPQSFNEEDLLRLCARRATYEFIRYDEEGREGRAISKFEAELRAKTDATDSAQPPREVFPGLTGSTGEGTELPLDQVSTGEPVSSAATSGAERAVEPAAPETATQPADQRIEAGKVADGSEALAPPPRRSFIEINDIHSFNNALEIQRFLNRATGVRSINALSFRRGRLVFAIDADPRLDILAALGTFNEEVMRRSTLLEPTRLSEDESAAVTKYMKL